MRLDRVILENFRCFDRLEVTLHPQMTVLTAGNGKGKTAVLDALRIALWPFVNGFDGGRQTRESATLQVSDLRLMPQSAGNMEEPPVPATVTAEGQWETGAEQETWTQARVTMDPGIERANVPSVQKLKSYAGKLLRSIAEEEYGLILPIVVHLGTSRLWYVGRFTERTKEAILAKGSSSRTSGYLNCLSYASNWKAFSEWYSWLFRSYREEQIRALEASFFSSSPSTGPEANITPEGERFQAIIRAVQTAINIATKENTGWEKLEYSSSMDQQLVMWHADFGRMPVDSLSDGLRNTVAMVADLAFRACKLNPHLGERAPLETPGIVLIDEVDMFLHPEWQQTILPSLMKAFPKVQFVVTTHSPQVLSTVRSENIRELVYHGPHADGPAWEAIQPSDEIGGLDSSISLNDVMNVSPIPPTPQAAMREEYLILIHQQQHEGERGQELRKALEDFYGVGHRVLREADLKIRSLQMQAKLRARAGAAKPSDGGDGGNA